MIKAVFFDIDGTLVDHGAGSVVHPSTKNSLTALHRKGIKLFVATGRIPSMLGFLEDIFPFDGYISLNGQLVKDRQGTVLHRMAHHNEDIRLLTDLVAKDPFPCLIIEEEESFYLADREVIAEHFHWAGLPAPGPYDIARLKKHPVLQFLAYLPPEETFRLNPLKHIEITSAGGTIFDIIPQKGGKEVGIAAAASHYGIAREEVMVFGDGNNDARMLRWAGLGVAMGNGSPAAKGSAAYVTSPIGEDGIQKALLHFGVLSPEDLHR